MTDLEVKSRSKSVATSYSYQFDHFGWAIFTVNDSTGELFLQSDWGSWSHRWNVNHLGCPTLTEFISKRADSSYIVGKLGVEQRVHDAHSTEMAVRRRLLDRRRDRSLDKEEARDAYDMVLDHDDFGPSGLYALPVEVQDALGHGGDIASMSEFAIGQTNPTWVIVRKLIELFGRDLRSRRFEPRSDIIQAQGVVLLHDKGST